MVSLWIKNQVGDVNLPIQPKWMIYILGFLLVTYIWFISERIFAYKDKDYKKELVDQFWSRMLVRAGIVSVLLVGWNSLTGIIGSSLTLNLPYIKGRYWRRALATDFLVSGMIAPLIQLVI